MTRDQANIAGAVRDELRMMFDDARELVTRALVMESTCAAYELPKLDGALMPKLGAAVLACEAALDAYDEYIATAGGMTATSLDGLKRASTPGQSDDAVAAASLAGARSGDGPASFLKAAA